MTDERENNLVIVSKKRTKGMFGNWSMLMSDRFIKDWLLYFYINHSLDTMLGIKLFFENTINSEMALLRFYSNKNHSLIVLRNIHRLKGRG